MSIKEQIRAEIERRKLNGKSYYPAMLQLLDIIESIHEEKHSEEKPTCKICGFYENNCPFIRDKFIPYPNKVCKDYTYSVMKAKEQTVGGLEEAAENYIAPIENDEGLDYINFNGRDIKDAFIAGAEWQKVKMMEEAVEGVAEELYNDGEPQCTVGVGTYFKPGEEVYVIKKDWQ